MSHNVGPSFCTIDTVILIITHSTVLALRSGAFCVIRLCYIPSTSFLSPGFVYGVFVFVPFSTVTLDISYFTAYRKLSYHGQCYQLTSTKTLYIICPLFVS